MKKIVPVNLKERDEFHLTIEEYLLALISLLDELVSVVAHSWIRFVLWLFGLEVTKSNRLGSLAI